MRSASETNADASVLHLRQLWPARSVYDAWSVSCSVHRAVGDTAAGRPARGRSAAASRAAGGHRPDHRGGAARSIVSRRVGSTPVARVVPGRRTAAGHARCRLAARHPAAAVDYRHGDRPVSPSARAPRRGQRIVERCDRPVPVRDFARRAAAGLDAAGCAAPAHHHALPWNGIVDLLGEDRGARGARSGIPAAHRRTGDIGCIDTR